MSPRLHLASLDEAEARLRALDLGTLRQDATSPWTPAQVFNHCAQSIEYSLTGYPRARAWVVRRFIGPRVLQKFLRQNFMTHAHDAAIPGAPALEDSPLPAARERLLAAIASFRAHTAPLAPHFAYGPVTRGDYERVHALHVADHLGAMLPPTDD